VYVVICELAAPYFPWEGHPSLMGMAPWGVGDGAFIVTSLFFLPLFI
jgi:hypothetical protein